MTNSGITSRLTTQPVYANHSPYQAEGQNEKSAKIGASLLAFYIFLLAGRVLDVSPIWWLHIPMMLLIVLTVTMISRGQLQYAFDSKVTKYFAAFTFWVFVCFPFSYWRAQSKMYMQFQVQSFVIFLIIVQMVRTRRDWERVVGGFAYATLVGALLAFHFHYTVEGRLALPGGTLGDPNEFALLMVVGLPFWWFKASRAKGFRKVFFLACTLPIFLAFARAGSRAGMLAMLVLFVISFIFAQGVQKIILVMTAVVAIVAATILLPGYIQTRFLTFFSPKGNYDAHMEARIDSDIASSEERKALLIQSIYMTFQHPILGVGPGCFASVAWDERKSTTGVGGESLVSHNTYTQVSSETGIPGFILFLSVVFLSVKSVLLDYRRLKPVDGEFAQYARYLFSCMGALAVGIFFLSVGYTHMTATIFAFALSLHKIVQKELDESGKGSPTSAAPRWQTANAPQRLSSPPYRGAAAPAARPQRYLQSNQLRPRSRRAWPPETSQ